MEMKKEPMGHVNKRKKKLEKVYMKMQVAKLQIPHSLLHAGSSRELNFDDFLCFLRMNSIKPDHFVDLDTCCKLRLWL